MKIATFTGGTSTQLLVEKPIANLLIKITGADIDLSTIKLTTVLNKKNGSEAHISTLFPLEPMSFLGSIGEGKNVDTIVDGKITIAERQIKLGYAGAIALLGGEQLRIDIEGLTAADTYVFHGIEFGVQTSIASHYKIIDVDSAWDDRAIDVSAYSGLAFDNSKITQLRVEYSNGLTGTMPIAELNELQKTFNDVSKQVSTETNYATTPAVIDYREESQLTPDNYVFLPLVLGSLRIVKIFLTSSATTDIWGAKTIDLDEALALETGVSTPRQVQAVVSMNLPRTVEQETITELNQMAGQGITPARSL